ncbi:hypothetical protein ANN_21702 [Periplaneta americana]|uniref:Per a allergen n=1 Tax=Periplaneta americana TaxID=6978 RepID=A0ABQ8S6I2_PERAM|nr:hypothetical protein ANN_21702 [Periplaneta americana]
MRSGLSLMLAGNEFQSLGRAIVKEDEYEEVRWDGIVSIVSWRERVFRLWWEERADIETSQEVKRRIAIAKEAFNRKRSIFYGPLEKELRKRLVKCFVRSVDLYEAETWTLRRSEEKRLEAFEM